METGWQDTLTAISPASPLSPHDRLLCKVLGIGSDLNLLTGSKSSTGGTDSLTPYTRLFLQQRIGGRIQDARTQLDAVAAELDCEGERSNLAAIYLDNLNSKTNKRLTITSVVTGALTTVATALISGKHAQTVTGVSGGLLSAAFALMTINPRGRAIAFYHERNLLKNIWEDQAVNGEYPFFVWRMLHEQAFSNSGRITLSQSIKNRWIQFEFDGKISKTQERLLFGSGGNYHSDDLHTRAAMLNQLQSTIRSIDQDLANLVAFIQRT